MALCQIIAFYALFMCAFAQGQFRAVVNFNQGGVVGQIIFTDLRNGSIQVDTSFSSGNFSGWHVHEFPADYTDDPATRCGNNFAGTGPHYDPSDRFGQAGANYSVDCNPSTPLNCEAGDLAGKFGPLQIGDFSFVDTDTELQLSGRFGVIGRSVVVHAPGGARIACGNIILQETTSPRILVATFVGPVAGNIYFRQSDEEAGIGTFIFARLFYTNMGAVTTQGHLWSIYTNSLNAVDYTQGECGNIGPLFDPTNVGANSPGCGPSNIPLCAVGDLSRKLGTIEVSGNPVSNGINAWTDGNLFNYNIRGLNIGLRVANGGSTLLACAPIVELIADRASADLSDSSSLIAQFTVSQRSPFDSTMLSGDVGASHMINSDGNIRESSDTTCYSPAVFTPFQPQTGMDTLDTASVGDLPRKREIIEGSFTQDTILPLSNRYSALGHNFIVNTASTCGTLNFYTGENVTTVRASAVFDSATMTGSVDLIQVLTLSNGAYMPGATLVYWNIRYNNDTQETAGHYWHVHVYRTNDTSPSTTCSGVVGGHFNPFGVSVGDDVERQVCNESTGSRYQLRCELGDLSGKHGGLTIRATNNQFTSVTTDSNLPLVGPYTVLGRSIAIHSHIDSSQIIACANIEPEVLSRTSLRVAFEVLFDTSIDIRVSLPIAIVDALNASDVEYGEVLVYEVDTQSVRFSFIDCNVVTLRFTDFKGGDPEALAARVRALDQSSLPVMYQNGGCPLLDLGTSNSGKSLFDHQQTIFLTILLLVVMIVIN